MRMGKLQKAKAEIPTCSMADIAFLLIIFFMVTTVFRAEIGLLVELPKASAAQKLPRKDIVHIWINSDEMISIDDMITPLGSISWPMSQKLMVNPGIIVSLLTDQNASYGVAADVFDELKEAGALKVSLGAKKKRGG